MYASTSARRASASIRRAPSRTISSITDDAADRAAPEPSRSAESETTVSIGSYLPDQRCRAGLAWNLSSVTREGTPHPKPIHRFQALLDRRGSPHKAGKSLAWRAERVHALMHGPDSIGRPARRRQPPPTRPSVDSCRRGVDRLVRDRICGFGFSEPWRADGTRTAAQRALAIRQR